ncbi:MAG: hypothetical protein ACRDLQ_02955 [Solirubrobacterales bacterium]
MREWGLRISIAVPLVVVGVVSSPGNATAVIPQGNLVANGDAEAGAGATDPSAFACPPAWSCSAGPDPGGPTAVRYGTPGFPAIAEGERIGGGLNFFAGGPGQPTSVISQLVNLGGASPEIDAGQAQFTLSACIGGSGAEADSATITAGFHGDAGLLGQAAPLAVTRFDRNDATKLLLRASSGPVPPGTRQILLEIQFLMAAAPYNDGYVDNLTVTMSGLGTLPPATTCLNSSSAPPVLPGPPAKVDKSAAKLSLRGNTTQRIARRRAVFVRVTADEAVRLSAKGTLSVPGASRAFKLHRARAAVTAGQTRKLRLRISKKTARAARRALRRKRRVRATVTVTAVDAAGNRSSARRRIRARR